FAVFSWEEPKPVLVHLVDKSNPDLQEDFNHMAYVDYLNNFCENSQREILLDLQSKYPNKIYEIGPY
ncbi:MAG: hypothetical protein ABIM21_07025, partial [candidate division WOR-3 bacterium]